MRRIALILWIAAMIACGSKSPAAPSSPPPTNNPPPTTNPPPGPPPITIGVLAGTVRETAPTAGVGIENARVEIIDGPNAGKYWLTSSNGQYTISDVAVGTFRVRASKAGYETREATVTLSTASVTQNFNLPHTPATITRTVTGAVSGGDATCGDFIQRPCKRHTIDAHNGGTITARLTWTGSSNDLDLELWRGDTRIANSNGVRSVEEISSALSAGTSYELRVIYYDGSTIANYTLQLTHPN